MDINSVVRIGFPFNYIDPDPFMVRGEGMYLFDKNEKPYLDLNSGIWNTSFGYGNKKIEESVMKQMNKLPFCNLVQNQADIQVQYAEKLCDYLGGFSTVLYTCSGSESVEAAIKSCRKYQQIKCSPGKKVIGAFELSYHGTSYGAMSISGIDKEYVMDFHPLLPEIEWIDVPEDLEDSEQWNKILEEFFGKFGDSLAGVIVEPIFASGGVVEIPSKVLQKLQSLCNESDALFVVDEVATGFGRTGYPFAFQKDEVKPDLLCLSKALNNGFLPLGVLAFSNQAAEVFANAQESLEHFSTQGGNLLSIAAADAVLEIMQEYSSFEVKRKGELLAAELRNQLDSLGVKVRGTGLMIAIDFNGKGNNEKLMDILEKLKRLGILAYAFNNPGHNLGISILPPFTIEEEMFHNISQKFARVFKRFL